MGQTKSENHCSKIKAEIQSRKNKKNVRILLACSALSLYHASWGAASIRDQETETPPLGPRGGKTREAAWVLMASLACPELQNFLLFQKNKSFLCLLYEKCNSEEKLFVFLKRTSQYPFYSYQNLINFHIS